MTDSTPAPRRRRPAKPEHHAYLDKAPSEVHMGFAEYILKTTGREIPVGDVGLVLRLYPLYLKSPAVVEAREAVQRVKDAEKAARDAEKRERAQARLAKIEEQRKRLLAELGIEDEGTVIDASDRFTDGAGITFEAAPEEPEEDEEETSDDEDYEDESDESDDPPWEPEEVVVTTPAPRKRAPKKKAEPEPEPEDSDEDWDDEEDEEDF